MSIKNLKFNNFAENDNQILTTSIKTRELLQWLDLRMLKELAYLRILILKKIFVNIFFVFTLKWIFWNYLASK